MPSVASEINAAQQSRFHQSQARGRTDGNDQSQSSPFADLLDSATPPSSDQTPAPRTARTDKSDDSRPAGQSRPSNGASDQNSANDAKSAGNSPDAANTKDAKTADATAKDATAGKGGDKTGKTDDSTAASTDANTNTKTNDDLTAALQAAFVDPTQQPQQPQQPVAIDPNAVALPQPVMTGAAQPDPAAGAGKTPQIDALAALQAAEQTAAAANAGAAGQGQAASTDDTKGKAQAADDTKGDGTVKKDAKADAKSDPKALMQVKSDAIADTKIAAAQSQSDSDDNAGQQGSDKPADPSRHSVAKPTPDTTEPDTRGHRATPAADAAKTAAVQVPNAQTAAIAASADAAASATATAAVAASSGASTAPTQPQVLTSTHIQAQLQLGADTSAAVQVSALPVEIATRAVAGKRQFEIRLDPPELGRVDVKVDIDQNGNATTRLIVDKAETLDLLKRDSQQLERALQQAGLKTSDNGLEFSLRQQSAQGGDQGTSNTATTLMVPDEDAAPLTVQRQGYGRLLGMSGGLDIRV